MKRIFLLVATAAMFAACSQTEELASLDKNKDASQEAVGFDVYMNTTRAGAAGELSTDGSTGTNYKASLQATGFGVFAYYSDNEKYSDYLKPNFMYNQKITYIGGTGTTAWTYEPAKYWPNEFGADASSEDVDYVSFFAYAPYVEFVPSSGAVDVSNVTSGTQEEIDAQIEFLQKKNIIGTIRNTNTGDPLIMYAVDWDPKTSVDLVWGVNGATDLNYNVIGTSGQSVSVKAGMPFVDMLKQANDAKISFNLRHALSWLNVQIDADFNSDGLASATPDAYHGTTNDFTDNKTKIWIRSISFDGFAAKGALDLKNEKANTPKWLDIKGADELETGSVTIFDGRKDNSEGVLSNEAPAEQPQTLNPQLIQSEPYSLTSGAVDYTAALATTSGLTGVTKDPQNLFAGAVGDQIYVIPTSEAVNVTIVYDVETKDGNLATYLSDGQTRGSSIQNRITKKDVFKNKLEAGKKYTLKLHLGMTDVKVEAVVEPWVDGSDSNTALPENY